MIYFKTPSGDVFGYETMAERKKFGAAELVKMTDGEVAALIERHNSWAGAMDEQGD